jgi:hypothetical protein
MKNKNTLVILAIAAILVTGSVMNLLKQPSNKGNNTATESESENYENLNSEILEFIAELAESLNNIQPDGQLSIETFELEPENEDLGEIVS